MRRTGTLIFIVMFAVCVFGNSVYAAADPALSKKELQRIKREMHQKKKELKRADKKERSILADLDRIDREVQAGKAELAGQQKRLREAETALKDVEKSNEETSRELANMKGVYGRRLRALYKMGRNGYATAVLAVDVQGDALKRIKYLGMIAEQDRMVIRNYGSALNALEARQAEISEKREALFNRKQTIEIKENELEGRKRQKALLLAGVREEKGLYEQSLRELEESSASLWTMIKKSEQERKTARAIHPSPQHSVGTPQDKNGLRWPVEGTVLTRFGMQQHPEFKTMVFRRGIEIAAREGEPVCAVHDGQVAYADWYKGYGKLMIIEHGPGFYTLYGNLSQLDLNKGDRALKGQVIGLAGETGSLKGSKLYFEIRRNGEAQDPLSLLAKR